MKTLTIVLVALVLVPSGTFAQVNSLADQYIKATISSDYSGVGVWTMPFSTRDSAIAFENYKGYGMTGLTSYTIKDIATDGKSLQMQDYYGYVTIINPYTSYSGLKNALVTYNFQSSLTKPVAIYEFPLSGATWSQAPSVIVNYPKDWTVLTNWPAGEAKNGVLTLAYKDSTAYAYPPLVVFAPSNLGVGNTLVKVGRFTIVGPTASVTKLQQAAERMTYLNELFNKTLGVKAPESVVIYAADLSGADVGYEAEALAAKPNLILYNNDILTKQSSAEIESTLVHEVTHIVELDLNFFSGKPYSVPWLREGLAVFVQNQARPYIYKNPVDQQISDLLGLGHMFSAKELKNKYALAFDYTFDGTATYGIGDSYSHAGVVMTNFQQKVGATGMQKFFTQAKTLLPDTFGAADHDRVIQIMTLQSGLSKEELLFPHKKSTTFDQSVASLTTPTYDDSALTAVAAHAKKLTDYFAGQVATQTSITSLIPVQTNATTPVVATSTSAKSCSLTRTLAVGSNDAATGGEVSVLQKFLVAKNYLASQKTYGYYGGITSAAVKKWQKDNGVSATGTVGPATRALFAKQCK